MASEPSVHFDQPVYGSDSWFCPKWAKVPEQTIGVTNKGLECLMSKSGLRKIEFYQGNWREAPGVFFQDVVIFEKT